MARYHQKQYSQDYDDENGRSINRGRYYGSSSTNYARNDNNTSNWDEDSNRGYGRFGMSRGDSNDYRTGRSGNQYGNSYEDNTSRSSGGYGGYGGYANSSRNDSYTGSNYGQGSSGSYDEDDYDSNYGSSRDYQNRSMSGSNQQYGNQMYGNRDRDEYFSGGSGQRYGQGYDQGGYAEERNNRQRFSGTDDDSDRNRSYRNRSSSNY